jgi:hypothetical protein
MHAPPKAGCYDNYPFHLFGELLVFDLALDKKRVGATELVRTNRLGEHLHVRGFACFVLLSFPERELKRGGCGGLCQVRIIVPIARNTPRIRFMTGRWCGW